MLQVVSAWTNLCRKARDGKLVYSVLMVHAWLNHAPLGKYKDLYETYLFVEEPKTFDWGWHLHDFLAIRQVLRRCGVLTSAVDVSRLSAVEVPPDSLQDSNWHLINMSYDAENFKEAKFGKGIIPFCHNDTVMANYRLEPFTTKCFPEGGFNASLPGESIWLEVGVASGARPQPSPAKAKRWTADSSDEEFKGTSSVFRRGGWPTCHSGSDGSQQPKKSRHWLAPESASSSDDIWRRGHNVGSARKHVVKETTAKSRPWTQNSSSSTAKSRPWTEINSSSSDGECPGSSAQGSSGVPVQAKCLGKPVVDVTIGALQLKSTSFTVREKLNSFEKWGFNKKRLQYVTRDVVCKSKRQ
jgi:hypothetical protein